MTSSRRSFLRLTGTAIAATQAPLTASSWAGVFEPSRIDRSNGPILLNSNENAYGPSARVAEAIQSACTVANRYPYVRYGSLIEQIASTHHITPDNVLLGCGSTEILRVSACAFLGHGKQLIQASPTFGAMERYASATGAEVISVPLTRSFAHDLDGMLARVNDQTSLVYICNPNNPTASLTSRNDLEIFVKKLPASAFVIIDEAYHHYASASDMYASFIDRRLDDERVIVVRTFSKVYGMAGLRLGYAVSASGTVQRMGRFATEGSINAIVTQAASVALADKDGIDDFVQRNLNDRQEFFNQAMARALKPIDSHTNFVMMNTSHPADEIIEHFRKNNVSIGRKFPPMETYIRVSLGRPEEMLAFWRVWDSLPYAKTGMMH
jgi:histidinol-phosphate aminotransferase